MLRRAFVSSSHSDDVTGTENAVPLARYFVFVGSVLIALLFVLSWAWPNSDPAQDTTAQAAMDAPIARIHSTQKWPDKIEFDTSLPTIVPPPAPAPQVAAVAPPPPTASASPLDARAEVKPNVHPAPARKRVARAHHRNPRQTTWADANPTSRPWSWSWNW
jgi:type IV secretory pathway VirB10-like protein